jgi:hypothetical protein
MKNFKYFILFLSFITIFEITNSKDANAVTACATNSDGEIVYATTPTTGCIAVGAATQYEITVKEIYLCTTAPVGPTTSAPTDLSDCENILLNSSATATSFAAGEDVNIPGTFKRPPNGTYSHAYVKFDNKFGITASMTFDATKRGTKTTATGQTCGTSAAEDDHDSSESSAQSVCGSSVTPGKLIEVIKQMGAPGTFAQCVKDGTVSVASGGSCPSLGSANAYLVRESDSKLSQATGSGQDFHGILSFTSLQKVTPDTTAFTVRFDVTNGVAVARAMSDTAVHIGMGPFDMSITIQ